MAYLFYSYYIPARKIGGHRETAMAIAALPNPLVSGFPLR
jgi:hypothetical protein